MFWWLAIAAAAEELPWTTGLPLGFVQLVAAEGQLPAENLAPLLGAKTGAIYDPLALRSDLEVLYSTGAFSAVEAHVEPWFVSGPDGEPMPAVGLTYQVRSSPRIAAVRVHGDTLYREREMVRASGLARGAWFNPDEDGLEAEWRILERYAELGFPDSAVDLRTEVVDGDVRIHVEVDPGERRLVEVLAFAGESPLSVARAERIARREGMAEGRPWTAQRLDDAASALQAAVREEGYPAARVNWMMPDPSTPSVVLVTAPGPRVVVEVAGPRRLAGRVERSMALDQELRFSSALVEELEERIVAGLQEEGRLDASARIVVRESAGEVRYEVQVEPGPLVRLERQGLQFVRVDDGPQSLDSDFLVGVMEQAAPRTTGRGRITPSGLEAGTEAIADHYTTRGHLGADVRVDAIERRDALIGERALVRIAIDEGPRTILTRVELVGVAPELKAEAEALVASLSDMPLSPGAVRRKADQIAELHRARGYAAADARALTSLSADRSSATVTIEVSSGEQLRLRNVILRGNRRTNSERILREVTMETGQVITPEALAETRSELYATELFRVVSLDLQGEGGAVRDLVVDVQEKPAWSFELGGGVATDEGLRTYGSVTRRNLWGVGHRLNLLGQVGVGYDGDAWRLDTTSPEWRAGLRYEAPEFPGHRHLSYAEVLLNEQEQEPTFRINRMGGGAGVQLDLGAAGQLGAGYRIQWRWLEDVDPGALIEGDPWLAFADAEGSTTDLGPRRQGELALIYLQDRRDDPFNPTRGTLYSVDLRVWEPLSSGVWAVRSLGEVQHIRPLGPLGLSLDARLGTSWVQGRTVVLPVEERFRLGGASTMRGYPLDSVGPKNQVEVLDVGYPEEIAGVVEQLTRGETQRWVATGGDSVALGTVELWVPFPLLGLDAWSGTSLTLFTDVGNTFFLNPTVLATSELVGGAPSVRYGVGFGVRQATPVGPLQVDVGFNPAYYSGSWAEERGEVPVRLHLSLGAL